MVVVLFDGLAEDKDVVHEDARKREVTQDIVHHERELRWRVGQAKGRASKLEGAKLGDERSLCDVVGLHTDPMKAIRQIELANYTLNYAIHAVPQGVVLCVA
jgi:hypothetical protein